MASAPAARLTTAPAPPPSAPPAPAPWRTPRPRAGGVPGRRSSRASGHGRRAQDGQLSQLDAEVESEEREGDRAGEQLAQVVGEAGAMHQAEHAGEDRSVSAGQRGARPVAHQRFSIAVATMVTGMRNSMRARRQRHRAGDGERERDRVAHREGAHHPHARAPLPAVIDGRQGEQEEYVVERAGIGDMAEAEPHEGEELAHRSSAARAESGWKGSHRGLIRSAVPSASRPPAESPAARRIMPA